jgi:hypothetical protein
MKPTAFEFTCDQQRNLPFTVVSDFQNYDPAKTGNQDMKPGVVSELVLRRLKGDVSPKATSQRLGAHPVGKPARLRRSHSRGFPQHELWVDDDLASDT